MSPKFRKKVSMKLNSEAPDDREVGGKFQSEIDFRQGQGNNPVTEEGLRKALPRWETETGVW